MKRLVTWKHFDRMLLIITPTIWLALITLAVLYAAIL